MGKGNMNNHLRPHSALGHLRPADYYHGDPEKLTAERRRKLAAARHLKFHFGTGASPSSNFTIASAKPLPIWAMILAEPM